MFDRHPKLVALVAGALAVGAFAPLSAWPLMLLSLAVLFSLWRNATPAQAAAVGFVWGFGLFGAGVPWLFVSLHTYGSMPAWMAAPAVALFCVYLAIYPMLAGWAIAKLRTRYAVSPLALLVLVTPAAFVAAESVRAWFMSGFPWLIVGYSQAPTSFGVTPLAGYAPLFGVYALSFLLCATAGAIAWLMPTRGAPTKGSVAISTRARTIAWTLIASVWVVGGVLQAVSWTTPDGPAISFALVQTNTDQQMKWRDDQRAKVLADATALAQQSKAKLTVLPETVFPMFLHDTPLDTLKALQQVGVRNGGDVLFGTPIIQAARGLQSERDTRDLDYFNSAITLGVSPSGRYDKSHLVAFGEYSPPMFAWVYHWLSIPLSNFAAGSPAQQPMSIQGTKVGVNICYEDVFGAEIARMLPEAKLLVNVSNLAWFGRTFADDQHVQFSQLRALETGRWLLRSTNTGITAAIDQRGRIVSELPSYKAGVLTGDAQPHAGATPYVRWLDAPVFAFIGGIFVWVIFRRKFPKLPGMKRDWSGAAK